uniref:Uncharacterized protein n=1 Tax=Hyaloperonospora arabidopsidis (strain Emoy2) TaxID=559515 RepID=M4BBS3_HYAAE
MKNDDRPELCLLVNLVPRVQVQVSQSQSSSRRVVESVHYAAPPVLAGSAVDDELLLCAMMERQLREIEAQHGILTRREVLAAIVREHAIKGEHAAAEYPSIFAAAVAPGVNLQ